MVNKRVIFGDTKNNEIKNLKDVNILEMIMLVSLAFFVIFFGFYPAPLMDTMSVSIDNLISNYQTDLILNMAQNK